jgi:hypothetical protein
MGPLCERYRDYYTPERSSGLRGRLAARGNDPVEIGIGPEPVFQPTELVAPAAYHLHRWPAPRPDRAALLRRALVWRALLAAGAVPGRASLARWQGFSRAKVTQVFNLLHRQLAL